MYSNIVGLSEDFSTFSTFKVLTVQSGRTSSDTLEMRMSLNTVIGLLSSGQYFWHRIWNATKNANAHIHTHAQICKHNQFLIAGIILLRIRPKTKPVLWVLLGVVFHKTVKSLMTHSAFLIALREHDDGAGPCFPDHPPKVSHGARKRTLSRYELVGTQVTLQRKGEAVRPRWKFKKKLKNSHIYLSEKTQSHNCLLGAVTHWDKAGVDVVWACSSWFWQQFHSVVVVSIQSKEKRAVQFQRVKCISIGFTTGEQKSKMI